MIVMPCFLEGSINDDINVMTTSSYALLTICKFPLSSLYTEKYIAYVKQQAWFQILSLIANV